MDDSSSSVSRLLEEARDGDPGALNRLTTALYRELQRLASQHLRRQGGAHSLRTTDLVHAAYLKLANLNQPDLQDKIRFLSLASLAMRSLLVDYARRRGFAKHGGNPIRVSLADGPAVSEPNIEVLAVDEALTSSASRKPRKCWGPQRGPSSANGTRRERGYAESCGRVSQRDAREFSKNR